MLSKVSRQSLFTHGHFTPMTNKNSIFGLVSNQVLVLDRNLCGHRLRFSLTGKEKKKLCEEGVTLLDREEALPVVRNKA